MKNLYLIFVILGLFCMVPAAQAASANATLPTLQTAEAQDYAKLDRLEKKELRKEVRSLIKENKDDQIIEIICALLIPPLGVYLHEDSITANFWVSLLLTFIPPLGSIFALLVVLDVFSL